MDTQELYSTALTPKGILTELSSLQEHLKIGKLWVFIHKSGKVISPFKGVITLEETTFFHVEWPIYKGDKIVGLVLTRPWDTFIIKTIFEDNLWDYIKI